MKAQLSNDIKKPKVLKHFEKQVCKYYEVSRHIVYQKTRTRHIVKARQVIMFLTKKNTKESLASIGFFCGGRDHATVRHSVVEIEKLIDTSEEFVKELYEILESINSSNSSVVITNKKCLGILTSKYKREVIKTKEQFEKELEEICKSTFHKKSILAKIAELPVSNIVEMYRLFKNRNQLEVVKKRV